MKTRIAKLTIGLILTVAVSIGLFRLGGHLDHFTYDAPSETFLGVLSDSTYSSKVETVKGFLQNELTSAACRPTYVGYEKTGELSESDIEKLALEQELISTIELAESITVYYSDNDASRSSSAYLLKMDGQYRYYVPIANDGETLTNSYFNAIFAGSNYMNCVCTTTANFRFVSPQNTQDATYRQVIITDYNKVYIDQRIPGYDLDSFYFREQDNHIITYTTHPHKDDGKYYSLDDINADLLASNKVMKIYMTNGADRVSIESFETMQDMVDLMFMMDLDASFFVKTSYGFCMPTDKYMEVMKSFAGEDAYNEIEEAFEKYRIHFYAEYYVSEGRISAQKTVLTATNGDDVYALSLTVNFTEFETAQVMLPEYLWED